jgi:hypothetical protein
VAKPVHETTIQDAVREERKAQAERFATFAEIEMRRCSAIGDDHGAAAAERIAFAIRGAESMDSDDD